MAAYLHQLDQQRLINSKGVGYGGSLYFYYTGTSVLAPIYTDDTLSTLMANPVVVAAGAIVPDIFLDSTVVYRRRIAYTNGEEYDVDPWLSPGTYTQDATGAVTRMLQDKAMEVVSIEDFGGVGDGVSDNVAAFTAADVYNKPVFIPAGKTYYTSSEPLGRYCGVGNVESLEGLLSVPAIGQSSLEVTVGPGGDFPNLKAAIKYLGDKKKQYDCGTVSILLQPGFVMAEQIILTDGLDLGWITITSSDATVPVDYTAITTLLVVEDGITPIFGATRNSTLPVIGCLFEYASNTTAKDGVAVVFGSKVTFLPGAGVKKARSGLKVLYGSEAYCYMPGLTIGGGGSGAGTVTGVDFSYAKNRACHVSYGSRAGLARSIFHHSGGDYAVYGIWNSLLDIYQSDVTFSTGEAVLIRDGSLANARDCNVSDSLVGFHALHGSFINARSRQPGDDGYSSWIGDGAKRCGTYAVLASFGSIVEAAALQADDNLSGRAINASEVSIINFTGGTATNATTIAVAANSGSKVNAAGADCSSAGTVGVYCDGSSSVEFSLGVATFCGTYGILCENGGQVNASNADLDDNPIGIKSSRTSVVNARSASIRRAGTVAANVIEGGRINVHSAVLTNAGTYGIFCRAGEVVANEADCSSAGTTGVFIEYGGIVKFSSGLGTLSTAANAVTANGIIFQ